MNNTNSEYITSDLPEAVDDNEINIEGFFEKVSYNNMDIEALHKNVKVVVVKENQLFDNFNQAESHIQSYAEFKALQFEKMKAFTKEIRYDIEFYIKICHFSTTLIKRILKEKYPYYPLYSKDLYTEIQRQRLSAQYNEYDTAQFYEELLVRQREDPRWFVKTKWEAKTTILTSIFWMSPELHYDDNMKSRIVAQALLSNETIKSYQWVLHMTKKATQERVPNVFVTNDDPAMECAISTKYSTTHHILFANHLTANQYLQKHLYGQCEAWAHGFTTTIFTLGIESTSFVKNQNVCIKRIIESSNTSLYKLEKVIINNVENIQKEKEYEEHIREISSVVNILTVFPKIEVLVSYYLQTNVAKFVISQMKESVFYTASYSNIEEVKCTLMNNLSENEDFENKPD
ncbi:8102_t:CDS:2, partial [Cetraspora pellucida]